MCIHNSYIICKHQCDEAPMPSRKYLLQIVHSLAATGNQKAIQSPALSEEHKLEHLSGKRLRVCSVCPSDVKKRTSFWCPGCNAGVHKECFLKLTHEWRSNTQKRKKPDCDSSDEN